MMPTIAASFDEKTLRKLPANQSISLDSESSESNSEREEGYLKEFCLSTSTNGLPNLAKAHNWFLRAFWLVLILASIGGCLYFIIISFMNYFSYNVSTTYSVVYESPSDFPAVTICNLVPFDTYNNLNYFQSILAQNGINSTITPTNTNPGIQQVKIVNEFLRAFFISNRTANQTFLQSLGFSIDSLLISCYYNNLRCFPSDFTWFYDLTYGNCYSFNKNLSSIKKTSKFGPTNGLQLELFTGIPGLQDYYSIQRGIYLAVTNNTAYPLTNYEGVKLSVSQSIDVRVSRTFLSKLDYPYSSCRKDTTTASTSDNDLYKRTLQLNAYSIQLCFDLCLQRDFITKECNCSDPSIQQYDTKSAVCKSLNSLSCVKSVKDKFDTDKITDRCSQFCPTPCNTVKYTTSTSSSGYPTDYYFKILAATPNLQSKFKPFLDMQGTTNLSNFVELVQSSVVKANVFYDDLNYISIADSQAMTIDTLFGTIGGEIGLFLGMSLLTIFEFVELGFKITDDIFIRIKGGNKIEKS